MSVSQEGGETQPPSTPAEWRGCRKDKDRVLRLGLLEVQLAVRMPVQVTNWGSRRQGGKEAGQGRNVVPAGAHLRPDPTVGSRQRHWPCVTPYPPAIGQGPRAPVYSRYFSTEGAAVSCDEQPDSRRGRTCQPAAGPHSVHYTQLLTGTPGRGKADTTGPGSAQPPQKPLSHSVSVVKLNRVTFEKTVCGASQGVRLGVGRQARLSRLTPSPGRVGPWKEASVVRSGDWHPSSGGAAEPGVTGKSRRRRAVRNEQK